ncbi:hypothetical protein GUG51_13255, partial [Xanthomonas citri pv. citri]|nr:hypothetical protein [Xanthomonas citri pv. citri]
MPGSTRTYRWHPSSWPGWPTDPEQGPDSFLEPVTPWQYRQRLTAQAVTGLSEATTVEQMETPMRAVDLTSPSSGSG